MKCLDLNQASEFIDGVTTDVAAVDSHLAECRDCRELLALMVSAPLDDTASPPPRAVPAASLEAGTEIGRFVIEERIGHGGMGVVYRARDPELDRAVAIKLVRFDAAPTRTAEARARLLREARAMARLNHPNVVTVYEAGTYGDQVFIAMELLSGETLDEHCASAADAAEIIAVFAAAGRGLAAAHEVGLVHRDFKPKNVIVSGGRTVVLDFGLVSGEEEPGAIEGAPAAAIDSGPIALTATGAVLGTPAYMSPEAFRGERVGPPADQYSFAVSLYEALAGSLPFRGKSVAELRKRVLGGEHEALPARVPSAVRRAVDRGLARDPADRFPSMLDMVAELEPPPRRPWRWIGVSAVALAVTAALVIFGRDEVDRCGGAGRIGEIWSAAARAQLARRFASLDLPYAAATAAEIGDALDEYAARWTGLYRQTCEAGRRGELADAAMTAQMACLDRRRRELAALADLLAGGGRDVVAAAPRAVRELSDLESCTDQTRLAAIAPPPRRPGAAAALDVVRDELAEVKALIDLGRHREALARASGQKDEVEALDYPVAGAEQQHWLGRALEASGHYAAAEEALAESAFLAFESGDDRQLVLSTTALVRVAGAREADFERGELWHRIARAVLARIDSPPLARGLDAARATLLAARGEFAEAEAIGARLLEQLEAATDAEELEIAAAHSALGSFCTDQYRYDCGAEHYQKALEIYTGRHGEHHPAVAAALTDLGTTAAATGKFEEALDHHRRALAIREAALGPDHPDLARSYHNLSYPLIATGELQDAERACERALEINARSLGAEHPRNAPTLYHLGYLHWVAGDYDDAYESHSRALAIQIEAFGDDHAHVGDIHIELGRTRRDQKRYADAAEHYRRALEIRRARLGAGNEKTVYTLTDLGAMRVLLGDPQAALPLLEEADGHWQATAGGDAGMRAMNDYFLADALWRTGGSRARARRLAARALEGYEQIKDAEAIERSRRWLRAH